MKTNKSNRQQQIAAIIRNTTAISVEEAKSLQGRGCATIFFMEEHRGANAPVAKLRAEVRERRIAEVAFLQCN